MKSSMRLWVLTIALVFFGEVVRLKGQFIKSKHGKRSGFCWEGMA